MPECKQIRYCYLRYTRSFATVLFTFLIITAFSNYVFSQTTSSIIVKARVISPISVLSKSDMNFGNDIVPGKISSVDKNSLSAGSIYIAGQQGKQVSVSFGLPQILVNENSSLPVSFADDDGIFLSGGMSAGEVFNPHNINTTTFPTEGTLQINLGGSVHPAPAQFAGYYNGLITVNLQYTGN